MRKWLRNNGLTLALAGLFLFSLGGQIAAGFAEENHERVEHAQHTLTLGAYMLSGAFWSALFENWESEFLQMWTYVMLTAYLFQRGSPESKDPDKKAHQDRDPALDQKKAGVPGPVKAGGPWLKLYSHSLGITLFALFVASFVLHWINSARTAADEAIAHGEVAPTLFGYLVEPQLWFESFQNWQSEFLSTAVLTVLAIWLREKGSPESKAVSDSHAKTGS